MTRTFLVRWGRRGALGVAALLILGFGVGSLAQRNTTPASTPATRGLVAHSASSYSGTGSSKSTFTMQQDASRVDAFGVADVAPSSGGTNTTTPPSGLGDRIIRNADVTVKIKKGTFDSAWANAARIATKLGGSVVGSSRGTQPQPAVEGAKAEPASGDLTVRVPSSRFEQALIEMRALGTVTSDQISSQDVTEEFVDLQSRLRNQKAQQAVLIRLMAQAKNVQETLAVQEQLSQVQGEIEQITGRLNALKTLTDLSSINLHLFEPGAVGAPVPPDEGPSFSQAWHTSLDGLVRMGTVALIGAMWLTPFALLALIFAGLRRTRAGASHA